VKAAVEALSTAFALLCQLVIALAGTALVLLVLITGWMVFTRYVLNDTATWVEKGALLAILWVVLPVAAVGVRERFHMAVEVVLYALPEYAREKLRIAADVLMLGFGIIMAQGSWLLVTQMWAFKIPLLGLSQGLQYLPMTICGVLTAAFAAEHLLRRLAGLPPVGTASVTLD
jgi:TRAP-type C4-dicarboxylate transport system permease small subunit